MISLACVQSSPVTENPSLTLLETCKSMNHLKQIHSRTIKTGIICNPIIQNKILSFCCSREFGDMCFARQLFDTIPEPSVFIWNIMFKGYSRIACPKLSECKPDCYTYPFMFKGFTRSVALQFGRELHCHVVKYGLGSNVFAHNALINMYALCGLIDMARGIFDMSCKSDVVTWNAMMSGYNRIKKDVISWTAIVTGFVNTGQVDAARKYFHKMPERDHVSWTAMIDGYLRFNCYKEALMLFREMQTSKIKPDEFTMVSILTACAQLGALELGEWIRTYIDKNKVKNDTFVGNALIDMYFKCGNVDKALSIFNGMPQRDKFTWTAMVIGLAINGCGEEALDMFSQMLKASVTPDGVTYVGVLSACTHTGMVEKGKRFFASMTARHGIEPNIAHYGCMVDLLGKAGHLKEAHEIIKNMPMKPNSIVWGALLGACRIHKNAEMAEMAIEQILELEPHNGAVYVLQCNIYAACNKWDKLRELRQVMMDRGIKKTPGCSLIEMNGIVHEFVAGDQSHPQTKEIYGRLNKMTSDLRIAGYSPNTSEVFLDIAEEDKENAVYRHSEKLAIAFGLINSGPGVTIRIVKNLRMCIDCHHVAKLVSKVYDREVIVRDRTRFHHFRHGSCSCKEYW
ncbi:pentatricopeptide repeat-containing protein [Salix suchowensis]|nr:pentatricopeptide repeat-containing protein [Salix suchowensis]